MYIRIYENHGDSFSLKSINKENFLIGSGLEADLHLGDKRVSKIHARVEKRGEEYFLVDEKSTNGVFDSALNEVSEVHIQEGTHVLVGPIKLAFSLTGFQKEKTQEIVIKPSRYRWALGDMSYSLSTTVILTLVFFVLVASDVKINYLGKTKDLFKQVSLEMLGQAIIIFVLWLMLVVLAKVFSGVLRTRTIYFELCGLLVFHIITEYLYYSFSWVPVLSPVFVFINHFKFFLFFVLIFRAVFYHNNLVRCARWGVVVWFVSFIIQTIVAHSYDPHRSEPTLEVEYSATGWNWGAKTNTTEDLIKKSQKLYQAALKEKKD